MEFCIIIPVYNVEFYLYKCVNSVLEVFKQRDFEIILVDDGSTDSSGDLCDTLAKNHSMIKVIHQKNGGLSDARNTGIRHSDSKYIIFLDSDDLICTIDFIKLENLLINKPDVVITNLNYYIDGSVKKGHGHVLMDDSCMYKREKILEYFISKKNITVEACRFIVNAEFLKKNQLKFKKGLLHEDELYSPEVLIKATKFAILNAPFYLYRKRENSIMSSPSLKRCKDKLIIISKLYKLRSDYQMQSVEYNFISYRITALFVCIL